MNNEYYVFALTILSSFCFMELTDLTDERLTCKNIKILLCSETRVYASIIIFLNTGKK